MAKIAVIDDSVIILDLLTEILEDQNHSVWPCAKADNVEEKLVDFSPDVILLDVLMPRNGYEVLRSLKRTKTIKDVPVILMSSKDGAADIRWGLKQGAAAYVTKPFTPKTIFSAIQPYLP